MYIDKYSKPHCIVRDRSIFKRVVDITLILAVIHAENADQFPNARLTIITQTTRSSFGVHKDTKTRGHAVQSLRSDLAALISPLAALSVSSSQVCRMRLMRFRNRNRDTDLDPLIAAYAPREARVLTTSISGRANPETRWELFRSRSLLPRRCNRRERRPYRKNVLIVAVYRASRIPSCTA